MVPIPRIIFDPIDQASSYRILKNVRSLLIHVFAAAQDSIEGFSLPNLSAASESFIDLMSSGTLYRTYYLGYRERFATLIDHRFEQKVNVIGHDNTAKQVCAKLIFMKAAREDDIARFGWEGPTLIGAEGHEQQLAVTLQMRQVAPILIFSVWHFRSRGRLRLRIIRHCNLPAFTARRSRSRRACAGIRIAVTLR